MPGLNSYLSTLAFISAVYAADVSAPTPSRLMIDQSEPIAPPIGEVKLGAANSANSWFAVRSESNGLAWTRTPFTPNSNHSVVEGKVDFSGAQQWIAWSTGINDVGIAAITAAAYDANGSPENGILVVDTNTSKVSFIRVGKFFPHWVKVDSRNRIWVVGWQMASIWEEEAGDFPLVRVYSQSGAELARALPRSVVGEATAQRAANWAFTSLLGDDFVVQVRGHQQLHRLGLNEDTGEIQVTTIPGPAVLAQSNSYVASALECGSSL